MSDQFAPKAQPRLLDPVDRDSELVFGLIMALTFTCTLSVAKAGESDVRTVVLSALACNVSWGIVDAVMYLLSCLADQGQSLLALRSVRTAKSADEVRPLIEDALPESVIAVLNPQELEELRSRIARLPAPPRVAKLGRRDYVAALLVFGLVVLSTVPVILPLVFIHDPGFAIRASNATAIALLFYCGRALGRSSGSSPLRTGLTMVAIGVVLVAITVVLGG